MLALIVSLLLSTSGQSAAELYERRFGVQHGQLDTLVINYVRSVRREDGFFYLTGFEGAMDGRSPPMPQREVRRIDGARASLRIFLDNESLDEPAGRFVEQSQLTVEAMLAAYWPDIAAPAAASLRIFPARGEFAHERSFRFEDIGVWYLEIAFTEDVLEDEVRWPGRVARTAHELYHLLASHQGLGNDDPRAAQSPVAAQIWEEVTAEFVSSCAALDALGEAHAYDGWDAFNLQPPDGPIIETPYADAPLHMIIRSVETGRTPSGADTPLNVQVGLALTLWAELSGGDRRIRAGTPEAEALLALCRRIAPDPWRLGEVFAEIATDDVDAPALGDMRSLYR